MLHQLEYSLQPWAPGEGFEESLQERDWRGVRNGRKENGEMQKGVRRQAIRGGNGVSGTEMREMRPSLNFLLLQKFKTIVETIAWKTVMDTFNSYKCAKSKKKSSNCYMFARGGATRSVNKKRTNTLLCLSVVCCGYIQVSFNVDENWLDGKRFDTCLPSLSSVVESNGGCSLSDLNSILCTNHNSCSI